MIRKITKEELINILYSLLLKREKEIIDIKIMFRNKSTKIFYKLKTNGFNEIEIANDK